MAQAVNEMLQGVAMVGLATIGTVIVVRLGLNKLFS